MLLMLVSIVQGYGFGLLIEKHRGQKASKVFLTLSILVSLGLLGYFKYADFFSLQRQRRHRALPAAFEAEPAHRHQLLHLSGIELRHRRLPRRNGGAEEFHRPRRLCFALPPTHRGADRTVFRRRRRAQKAARTASPPRRRACAALRSALPRKFCSPTSSARSRAPTSRRRTRASSSSGSTRSRFCSKSISTFRATAIWPSASGGCWASTSLKTSTTPIFQRASRSSGAGGTCRLARGSATTSISLSAAAGRARRVSC